MVLEELNRLFISVQTKGPAGEWPRRAKSLQGANWNHGIADLRLAKHGQTWGVYFAIFESISRSD